jgi:hypothetical protein
MLYEPPCEESSSTFNVFTYIAMCARRVTRSISFIVGRP